MSSLTKALLLAVCAAFLCAVIPMVTQKALAFASINQISVFRNVIILILSTLCIFSAKKKQGFFSYLRTQKKGTHLIRSLSGFLSASLFLFSLKTIGTAEANVLNNLSPMYLPLTAYLWKRSPVRYYGWQGVLIAFFGTVMLIKPTSFAYNIGLCLALLSGLILSITFLAQQIANATEPFYRSLFYYSLLSTCFTLVWLSFESSSWTLIFFPKQIAILILLGILGFLTQLSIIAALRFANAKFVTPFLYCSILFSLGFDVSFGHKLPSLMQVGGVLLILSGLYTHFFLSSRREKRVIKISNELS